MTKKKKGTDGKDSLKDALENIVGSLSKTDQNKLEEALSEFLKSGMNLQDLQEQSYIYQRPDYTKMVKPLPDYLQTLLDTALPNDTLTAYHKAYNELSKLNHQEQEDAIRNLIMQILADGLSHDFDNEQVKTSMPLLAIFQLIDDFELTGLFDIILETLKQKANFFTFYYMGFEDAATLILAHVGKDHLEELKEIIKTEGFLYDIYAIIFDAVVQMAVENPACRLQVLAWVADVLNTCIDHTLPAMGMDMRVKTLAQIKASDLLPLIKNIYKEYHVPAIEIKSGIKGVTKLLSNGTEERVVEFADFKSLLKVLAESENDDSELDDDEEYDYNDDEDYETNYTD